MGAVELVLCGLAVAYVITMLALPVVVFRIHDRQRNIEKLLQSLDLSARRIERIASEATGIRIEDAPKRK